MPTIVATRLLEDLRHLRSFGAFGSGVVRPSLSAIDLKARQWLAERMSGAGLRAEMDGIGNVFGYSNNAGPALLVGSHSDTQPTGGWLDGALGVIYAIEAVRALREDPRCQGLAVDAVAWVDEESTFASCLGSRSYCGMVTNEEFQSASNDKGEQLTDVLAAAGMSGEVAPLDPERYLGYLEAHIEQGPHLEASKRQIGVVTSIVGSRNFTVTFTGQQNHAGTTPMAMRRDAGLALMQFGTAVHQAFQAISGPNSVWTMGQARLVPGAPSIIPGEAILHLQFRDPLDSQLDQFEKTARDLVADTSAADGVRIDIRPYSAPVHPAPMNESFQESLAHAAQQHVPGRWVSMPSAAVHDAMFLAQVMPAGMMFIPSIRGISHDFAENTSDDDIVTGAQVFTDAIARILLAEQAASR